jgi:hypothetical protein
MAAKPNHTKQSDTSEGPPVSIPKTLRPYPAALNSDIHRSPKGKLSTVMMPPAIMEHSPLSVRSCWCPHEMNVHISTATHEAIQIPLSGFCHCIDDLI